MLFTSDNSLQVVSESALSSCAPRGLPLDVATPENPVQEVLIQRAVNHAASREPLGFATRGSGAGGKEAGNGLEERQKRARPVSAADMLRVTCPAVHTAAFCYG